MADDTWRYAEPDGKQRALSLDDLQRSLARGLLPTNVPVWRSGFADWTPASDVPELRASVAAGARVIPPKGAAKPGRPVAQRGGAAATGDEPMSPPSYAPARKARPVAPALPGSKPGARDSGSMRSRASTLLIAGGAPASDHNPESEAAPINVPAPGGAQEGPNTITRPPPLGEGTAEVVPSIPSSSGKIGIATTSMLDDDDEAETREMPAAQRATLRDQAWADTGSAPSLEVESSMLLPDTTSQVSVPEVVSTSMLLPTDSSGTLPQETTEEPAPDSVDLMPDSEVASVREPTVRQPTVPPPLTKRPPSSPGYSSLTGSATGPTSNKPPVPSNKPASTSSKPAGPPSRAPSRPSFPSRAEVRASQPDTEAADRIGLHSKPPPPDINPLSSDFPPPPGVPAEMRDGKDKSEKPAPAAAKAEEQSSRVVPLWGAIAAVAAVGVGVWVLRPMSEDPPPAPVAPAVSSVAAPVVPVASASAKPDAGAPSSKVTCTVSRTARPIVSDVQPVDLGVTMHGDKIAIGYAKSAREAHAAELDGASLAVTNTVTAKSPGAVSRVVAHYEGDTLVAQPEFPNMTKGVALQRRDQDVVLGVAGGKLVRVLDDGTQSELFTMPSHSADRLRISAVPSSKEDVSYIYHVAGAVWFGTTQKDDAPQRVPGLGGGVGTPTLVSLDASHVLAAWPDRATEKAPWSLRLVAYAPGKGNVTPKVFQSKSHPGSMLAPALVRISDTHALLLWTLEKDKGGDKSYEVLGQTLDAKGAAVGEPFVVSAADMNAGQAQAMIDSNGRGTVAFFVMSDAGYDVAVAGIDCK